MMVMMTMMMVVTNMMVDGTVNNTYVKLHNNDGDKGE